MKKLLPILVVAIFLMVGLLNVNLLSTDTNTNTGIESNDLQNLPAAKKTDSGSAAECEGNNDKIEDIETELDINSAPEVGVEPLQKRDHSSRFKVTTSTAIVLSSPANFQNYSYEENIEITGRLFEDNSSNGIFDPGQDIPIEGGHVRILFGDEPEWVETDADGVFTLSILNTQKVKGVWDLNVSYSGQYTINGSVWYDVDQEIGVNEDNDYFLDVDYELVDPINGTFDYKQPFETAGNGVFDPPHWSEGSLRYEFGDVIIRDTGDRAGEWDSSDTIVTNPILPSDLGGINIFQYYGNKTEISYIPLIDEEIPNTYDQSLIIWADHDGDWDIAADDDGEDGLPGTSDNGEGDQRPTPGEDHVDEDIMFTRFRKPSSVSVMLGLWHDTEIYAVVENSTGKQTERATVGDTITIKGSLKDKVNPSIKPYGKHLKIKIFGNFMPGTVTTDNRGEFNYTYEIPENPTIRVGIRHIDIMFDDKLYDPDYNLENNTHEFLRPTYMSEQDSGPIALRIYRPTKILFEKSEYVGYLFKSLTMNGTVRDDNNNALYTTIYHDDGSSEVITTAAYHMKFEWGRQIDQYYDTRDQDLLDATGNFTIAQYEINDPFQETGEIRVRVHIITNDSMTYYLDAIQTITVIVRSKATISAWIDQDLDGHHNEKPESKKGPLADYITRTEFIDADGNAWDFNKIVVYGRLTYSERPEVGITGKVIKYYWEDEYSSYEESGKTVVTKATHDLNMNGKIDNDEMGLFIMPDPEVLYDIPKMIQKNHPLGPLTLHLKYEDESDYIDPIEHEIQFDVVAMTKVIINSGTGVKGEELKVTGKLVDDLGKGVPNQNINLYWEDLEGELLVDGKYNPMKLSESHIGNVTTDGDGEFSFNSEDVLTRDKDVGQGYVIGIFDGSIPPFTDKNAYIGSVSDEVIVDVSSHTKIELSSSSKNQRMIRGKSFTVEGQVIEMYEDEKNTEKKVLLTIADVDQMELYIKNVNQANEVKITDITVEYKSEGGFTITGTVPFNLDVGTAELRLVFKGSKNMYYLGDEDISYHEIWADTFIKILAPDIVTKESEFQEAGYFLREDIRQEEYDESSDSFIEPGLVFQFQLLEVTEGGIAKPVMDGRIELTINATYSVFRNFTVKFTDSEGLVNFTFKKPLTDTDWGYKLSSKAQEELEINVAFTGKDYYLSTETLPIETTHWPPKEEGGKGFYEEWGWLIWLVVIIVIAFLIVFVVVLQWYKKQMRIRGMRRIIKRAADQLIAGNEYTAVIFKSYQKLGVHLRKYGYLRRESETFREFEDAVRRALPIDRISMDKFLILLEEARYSSHQIGENQRNDAILNLRAIERSLDRIIIDEGSAVRALERLETEGVKETKIVVDRKPSSPQVPELLKKQGPAKSKTLTSAPSVGAKPDSKK